MCDFITSSPDTSILPNSLLMDLMSEHSDSPGMEKYANGEETFEEYWLNNNIF